MVVEELMAIFNEPAAGARICGLLREGLTNGAAIPEIETEAEQAAHYLLGCVNFQALMMVYATANDLSDENEEADVRRVVSDMADAYLRTLVDAVMFMRGPVGQHICEKGY